VSSQLAAKQLAQAGFLPFRATLGTKRDVQLLIPKSMKQDATRDELDAYWAVELRRAAAAGECKTVCSCADVHVPTDEGVLIPAVLIHIEHAEVFSENILYPYQKEQGSEIIFGEPAGEATEHRVFVRSLR